jgi:hypothetical protein
MCAMMMMMMMGASLQLMHVLIIGTCRRTFFVFELFSTVFVGTFALRIAQ